MSAPRSMIGRARPERAGHGARLTPMVMLDIASRFEPAVETKGRSLALCGLMLGLAALPTAFWPSLSRAALTLAGAAVLVSGIALVGALGGRRHGRNIAGTGAALGLVAAVAVLAVQATYAPGLPARDTSPDQVVPAVVPKLKDIRVTLGRYGATGVPVEVTNNADRLRSVDLTVEAVTAKGRRIATDTVSASLLVPGATTTVAAFDDEPAALAAQLRGARFRLIEAAQFA